MGEAETASGSLCLENRQKDLVQQQLHLSDGIYPLSDFHVILESRSFFQPIPRPAVKKTILDDQKIDDEQIKRRLDFRRGGKPHC